MLPSKFAPVLISTAFITAFSVFPFISFINFLCCAGVMLGSFIGTSYYNKQLKKAGDSIIFKDGAAIGLLSGILSAMLTVMILTILSMAMKENPVPFLYEIVDKHGIALPPDVEKMLQKISDEYSKSGFSITITIVNLIVYIITYPIFAMLGGIIAVSIFRRKRDAA